MDCEVFYLQALSGVYHPPLPRLPHFASLRLGSIKLFLGVIEGEAPSNSPIALEEGEKDSEALNQPLLVNFPKAPKGGHSDQGQGVNMFQYTSGKWE